jgi:hypothetical protein
MVFAEHLGDFERALERFLSAAAEARGRASSSRRQLLSTLRSAVNSFETALMVDRVRPQGARLVCPLSADGMEYYRGRSSLTDEQWERVRESLAELSRSAGEEVSAHLQRQLGLPCRGCQAVSPLTPLPGGLSA